jgi:ribosomal protein S18 acetylase RimI-like enzyme
VVPLAGWSDHVGEIRLVVGPGSRGTGLGRELARTALSGAVQAGLAKVVVELVADQESALRLFTDIGFGGEALLTKHVRDRDGNLRDLIMLAHYVDDTWSLMDSLGLADELAE